MNDLIGREKEIERLNRALEEKEAQLIIVYGRRRVGKTFLINEFFNGSFAFHFTGSEKQVVFLDELPWMDRQRSALLTGPMQDPLRSLQ